LAERRYSRAIPSHVTGMPGALAVLQAVRWQASSVSINRISLHPDHAIVAARWRVYALYMVNIVCDDAAIEKTLIDLYRQVQAGGGFVHDKLTIASKQGEFQILAADDVPQAEKILMLPKQCLLPADSFTLGLEDNTIIIKAHDETLSSAQVEMMETMVALYNLTGKIATQKRISTLSLYYEDTALFEMLLRGRSKEGVAPFEEMVAREKNDFYIQSFIKTRVLGFKVAGRKSAGQHEKINVLMPIIDFLNHHPAAAGFVRRFAGGGGSGGEDQDQGEVTILKYSPARDNEECYVNYGPYEALDTLLHYNYTDRNAGFVRSVPLTYRLPGVGTISVCSSVGRVEFKSLPEKLQNIRFYIPGFTTDRDRNDVELSFLYIPLGNAPRSMRRVLALALNKLAEGMDEADRVRHVRLMEKQIIGENVKYYSGLLDYMESCELKPELTQIGENIREMARHQLLMIRNYPFFAEAMAMHVS